MKTTLTLKTPPFKEHGLTRHQSHYVNWDRQDIVIEKILVNDHNRKDSRIVMLFKNESENGFFLKYWDSDYEGTTYFVCRKETDDEWRLRLAQEISKAKSIKPYEKYLVDSFTKNITVIKNPSIASKNFCFDLQQCN